MDNKIRTYCVYMHKNIINNKIYIGQTKYGSNPYIRWGYNGNGYREHSYFAKAINKYGWDNFIHKILISNISSAEADEWESYYIWLYNTTNSQYGYNLRTGGKQKYEYSDKIKDFRSVAHREDVYNSRRVRCIETGDVFPCVADAARWCGSKKIYLVCSGERAHAGVHPQTGEQLSWEYVDNDSPITITCSKEEELKLERIFTTKCSTNDIKVQCLNTGQIFNSISEAAIWYSGKSKNGTCISRCCRGERQSAGKHPETGEKLKWKYYEE